MKFRWQVHAISSLFLAVGGGCSSSPSKYLLSSDSGQADSGEVELAGPELGETADGATSETDPGTGGMGVIDASGGRGGSHADAAGGSAGNVGSGGTGGGGGSSSAGAGGGAGNTGSGGTAGTPKLPDGGTGVGVTIAGAGGWRTGTGGAAAATGTTFGSGGSARGAGGTNQPRDAGLGGSVDAAAGGAGGGQVGGSVDSSVPDVFSSSSGLGEHALVFKRNGESSADLSTPPLSTRSSNSLLLTCVGRGVISAHAPPKDNKGNKFSQLGTAHAYTNWSGSGTACYTAADAAGGSGHVVSALASSIAPEDETTLIVVEITNATRVSDFQWNEVLKGKTLTSRSGTTGGPATLVAFWWGDGDSGVNHVAVPNNGFTTIDSVLETGSLVQGAVAVKMVSVAGTYDVTWTSTEGAQMWLMAVE